jgi:large subunit ribosomal protein L13
MKTFQPKAGEIRREWHQLDASKDSLGRIATQAAMFLMGKNKGTYSPHMDSGDFVVVINCDKAKVTGKKAEQKLYRSHSGFPGGFKEINFNSLQEKHPGEVVKKAISGMLPDNRLKDGRLARLKIVIGERHSFIK